MTIARLHMIVIAAALVPQAILAAEPVTSSRVKVFAVGEVETPPDIATIGFSIRGEGKTSDAAASALVARKDAIEAGITQFADTKVEIKTNTLSIDEARGKDCDSDNYDSSTRLSAGPCAVLGYVATVEATVRLAPVQRAGTLVSIIGRLGGTSVHLSDFALRDSRDANRRALAAAMANGREQADAIAASSKSTLGRLVSVEDMRAGRDGGVEDIVVSANRAPAALPPPRSLSRSRRARSALRPILS